MCCDHRKWPARAAAREQSVERKLEPTNIDAVLSFPSSECYKATRAKLVSMIGLSAVYGHRVAPFHSFQSAAVLFTCLS